MKFTLLLAALWRTARTAASRGAWSALWRHTGLGLALLGAASLAQAQGPAGAHQHGLVTLDIAIEPGRVTVLLDAPLQALLGHERAPRSAAERQAAAALLARLRAPEPLWRLDAALQCALTSSQIEAPTLQASAPGKADKTAPAAPAQATDHADLNASYEYRCSGPGQPKQLDVGPLLDAFKGIAQIEARIVEPKGQHKARLKRPARLLTWSR